MRIARTGIAVLALLAACVTPLHADGCFVWRNERVDIHEPEQKALILFDAGREDLVLEVRYEGAPDEFGWIVPLPTNPRMRADRPELFESLSRATQEVSRPCSWRTAARFMTMGGTSDPVRVLQRTRVGLFDAAVVQSKDAGALQRWIAAHGFRAPRGATPTFAEYARRGWVFVALRITPSRADRTTAAALASGTLQPIRFRFSTPEPVFPLRVSALGAGRANVLLYVVAPVPLVHRTCAKAVWTENACGPVSPWSELDPDTSYRGLANERGFLTKLRASVTPEQMEDVYFKPYDPMRGLAGIDERSRAESVAHLGWLRPKGADVALLRYLRERAEREPSRRTAIWALGEVGGPAAESELLRLAGARPWWERLLPARGGERARSDAAAVAVRLEAIEALARMRSRSALPVFVDGIADSRPDRRCLDDVAEACMSHLIEWGDGTCLPALRAVWNASDRFPDAPGPPVCPTRSERLLAAMAACGDSEAKRILHGYLLDDRAVLTRAGLASGFRNHASELLVPRELWPTRLLREGAPSGDDSRIAKWHAMLESGPALHDALFREAARDARMPPIGRMLLLGLLVKPAAADRETLLALGCRAMRDDSLTIPVAARCGGSLVSARINLAASTAACALARQHAVEELLELWRECPREDSELRGELAVAMARAGGRRLMPALADYVRAEWSARFAALQRARGGVPVGTPSGRPPDFGVWPIDLDYRQDALRRAFTAQAADRRTVCALTTDANLSPWLRTYWMWNLSLGVPKGSGLAREMRRSLTALEASRDADGPLGAWLAQARWVLGAGDGLREPAVRPEDTSAWR